MPPPFNYSVITHDNRWSNRKDIHSKINELSSPVISVYPPLNNSVINPPQLSSVQSSSSSHNTPRDNRCFNFKDSNSKSNKLSSPVIIVPPLFNKSVINPPQLPSVHQQSYSYSHNTPRDNRCFNFKDSHSKSNEFSSPVIPVPPPLNDSVISTPQISLVCQQSSSSSQNTAP